jgi:hypothetical protein
LTRQTTWIQTLSLSNRQTKSYNGNKVDKLYGYSTRHFTVKDDNEKDQLKMFVEVKQQNLSCWEHLSIKHIKHQNYILT